MPRLPDLEGMAIFAKVVQLRSFSAAAAELGLSKATVSKAVSRLEARLATHLLNRTSRRFALTDAGRRLADRTAKLLADAEVAEDDTLTQSIEPRGVVRVAAPMSYGVQTISPLLPEFLALYPEVVVELELGDQMTDLIGEGFDAAIRIASLPDSSLVARTLTPMARYLVGAPSYVEKYGRPAHPLELNHHRCIGNARAGGQNGWHFSRTGHETVAVRPSGPLRINSGDALLPSLYSGVGLAVLPEFLVADALTDGRIERILPDWSSPGGAVHWVTPPGGRRPKRVEVLGAFLARKLSRS
jgi:DNA-binding transcriptional LysR family regulator